MDVEVVSSSRLAEVAAGRRGVDDDGQGRAASRSAGRRGRRRRAETSVFES